MSVKTALVDPAPWSDPNDRAARTARSAIVLAGKMAFTSRR